MKKDEQWTYREKFIQINKEARATWILFLIMALWWFGTGIGLRNVAITIFGIPLWVWLSTVGTVVVASAGCYILTRFVFKNFSLDEEEYDA